MGIYDLARELYHRIESMRSRRYLDKLIRRGLTLGPNVDIVGSFFFDPSHCFLISIGDGSIICPNVRLIAHDASTKKLLGYTKIGRIDIKPHCFIGDSTLVLPNVTIGPNSIVGAGSVVVKDVPPYAVAAGNPARVICSLTQYKDKFERISQGKKIFSEDYWIDKLDDHRRLEILEAVRDSIAFMV
jgi:maltose O-acetyltransferase